MTRYHRHFKFTPDDLRVWFDQLAGMWRAQRWDRKGGTISSKRLECQGIGFRVDGEAMRMPATAIHTDSLQRFTTAQDVVVSVMRLAHDKPNL